LKSPTSTATGELPTAGLAAVVKAALPELSRIDIIGNKLL